MEGKDSLIHETGLALLDLFLPRRCIVCGRSLYLKERFCCTVCRASLPYTYYWTERHNAMADRFNAIVPDENSYVTAVALFFYDSGSGYEKITKHLKYEGGIRSGRFFSEILADKIIQGGILEGVDCVIPVPLHWRRRWKRGYNQAEIIARVLSSRLGARLETKALRRKRSTKSQTEMSIEDKAKNVEGAFEMVRPVRASHILLVDDVFTSGATLAACLSALRPGLGPSCRISIATLACVGE